jgi:hypothetical protein
VEGASNLDQFLKVDGGVLSSIIHSAHASKEEDRKENKEKGSCAVHAGLVYKKLRRSIHERTGFLIGVTCWHEATG